MNDKVFILTKKYYVTKTKLYFIFQKVTVVTLTIVFVVGHKIPPPVT